ncbi:hypothetical protein K1T71_006633 [Dendrolimus kikuchii]|uniref:Uncharacterized protein n=1 Tax=Dendrolimus kikuchii TaxID=765133 RepID=A0ACC1D1R4_9NEOP|nr:hypothetical protein K1T71_006633 [Dendrolimus kikuchii]
MGLPEKCCFCISLRTGVIIFAVLHLYNFVTAFFLLFTSPSCDKTKAFQNMNYVAGVLALIIGILSVILLLAVIFEWPSSILIIFICAIIVQLLFFTVHKLTFIISNWATRKANEICHGVIMGNIIAIFLVWFYTAYAVLILCAYIEEMH